MWHSSPQNIFSPNLSVVFLSALVIQLLTQARHRWSSFFYFFNHITHTCSSWSPDYIYLTFKILSKFYCYCSNYIQLRWVHVVSAGLSDPQAATSLHSTLYVATHYFFASTPSHLKEKEGRRSCCVQKKCGLTFFAYSFIPWKIVS